MHTNRLANEKSPYLLQHAHNPVDWFPWGPEAFEKARAEDKPIFLSIGYSTCHWCHVMERESFESDQIAALLNRDFVPIKVDREERPDVDRIYMTFVQATTGGGGWPMSVFLTPELKPFFGGTYFPPENRYGHPGFGSVLTQLASAWRAEHQQILDSAREIVEQPKKTVSVVPSHRGAPAVDRAILESGFFAFRRSFDTRLGGFGGAPKFPRPSVHNFLVRYYARTKNQDALEMVLLTLREMAKGGMNDQLGGGFHRYSVDDRWFVPHFEKMLYDQAQLAISYLEAYQITHNTLYADIARSTLDYVLRDMTHTEGGFYSAEDADSVIDPSNPKVKGEGAFYIWTAGDLEQVLGHELYDLFAAHYGVEKDGNVHQDPHGEFIGKNILYLRQAPESVVATQFAEAKAKLLAVRSKRVRPHLDDKILTSWNALMISAFAKAAQILDEPRYLAAAQRATQFILSRMYDVAAGILQRRFREGESAIHGFLDDYAFFIAALLDLYEADFDPRHLEAAIALTGKMRELFEDPEAGAFFTTAGRDSSLVLRMKDDYDGAEPSGNSVALLDLLRLAHLTDRDEYRHTAARTLDALMPKMSSQPVAVPQMLVALDYSLAAKREVVIAGDLRAEPTRALLHELRSRFLPYTVVLLIAGDTTREKLLPFFPAAAVMTQLDGQATAYVCENYTCRLPTTEVP